MRISDWSSDVCSSDLEGADVGTTFDVEGIEARLELVQNERGGWRGSSGMQYYYRDFLAVGEEAYVPPNRTGPLYLFKLQEFGTGPVQLEAGGRDEFTDVESPTQGHTRHFETVAVAMRLDHEGTGGVRQGCKR